MPKVLTVKNLNVDFEDQRAISGLNFELNRGEALAIIGPNGSGKTALLRSLLNIIPYEGRIEWEPGVSLGYVPQKIDADRHLPMNVSNLLVSKAKILKISNSKIHAVIEKVGITRKILETPVGHLSGGQFQKALIAFALLGNPDVILFDEPTASLDELSEGRVYEIIHDLQDKEGITVILVSHELNVVYRYATQVLCLNKEKICYGNPEEVLTPEVLKRLYGSEHKFHQHYDH